MDFGEAKFMYSRRLNNQLLIVHSARIAGSVFMFHKKYETHFACSSCKSLGKNRIITVANGRMCDRLHQEIIAYLPHASFLIAGNET